MGHANIYIRKEHEEYWNKLPDKSAWVNERLEQSFMPSDPLQPAIILNPKKEPHKALNDIVEPLYRNKKKGKL